MRLNINHLLTFAALARTGSFSGAAEQLSLPSSTVTNHIAALEEAIGVQLVARTTRRARLTEFGERLAKRCVALADMTEDTKFFLATERTEPSGTLRISVPFTFAHDLLAPVIGRFAELHPKLQIELALGNERPDLIEEGFDLAIRIGSLADSSLIRQRLGRARNDLVASRRYLDRVGRPANPQDLRKLCFMAQSCAEKLEALGPDGPVTLDLEPQITVNDPRTIFGIVSAGNGFAALPRFLTESGLVTGELETVLPEYSLPSVDLSIVHYGASARNPNIAIFVAFMVREMASLPALSERAAS